MFSLEPIHRSVGWNAFFSWLSFNIYSNTLILDKYLIFEDDKYCSAKPNIDPIVSKENEKQQIKIFTSTKVYIDCLMFSLLVILKSKQLTLPISVSRDLSSEPLSPIS